MVQKWRRQISIYLTTECFKLLHLVFPLSQSQGGGTRPGLFEVKQEKGTCPDQNHVLNQGFSAPKPPSVLLCSVCNIRLCKSACACGKMPLKWDVSSCFVLDNKFYLCFFIVLMLLWKKKIWLTIQWFVLLINHWDYYKMCDWADRCMIIRKHSSLPKLLI